MIKFEAVESETVVIILKILQMKDYTWQNLKKKKKKRNMVIEMIYGIWIGMPWWNVIITVETKNYHVFQLN